jgi:iron complex transport system substrate-binding protein
MLSCFKCVAALIGFCVLASTSAFASRELNDELGRRVTLPDEPKRVVCLAPSLTETVYALGRGEAVVGVTDFTDYPPEAQTKPSVGGLTDASLERIVALHPDLVLAIKELNQKETVEELERLGVPVYVVDPQGLRGILASIQHLGEALNRTLEAARLLKRLEDHWAAVAARVQGRPRIKVLVVVWYDPVITAGSKSYITEVIAAAGAQSVTAQIPQAWPEISLEEVLRRSPDFLLLVRGVHGGITLEDLEVRAGWDQLQAVKDHRVTYMGERLFRPSPVVFDALEQLAKEFHPEAFQPGRDNR